MTGYTWLRQLFIIVGAYRQGELSCFQAYTVWAFVELVLVVNALYFFTMFARTFCERSLVGEGAENVLLKGTGGAGALRGTTVDAGVNRQSIYT